MLCLARCIVVFSRVSCLCSSVPCFRFGSFFAALERCWAAKEHLRKTGTLLERAIAPSPPALEYLDSSAKTLFSPSEKQAFSVSTKPLRNKLVKEASTATAILNHLRGKGCQVFFADVKVEVSENGSYHYPDVMVSCDSRDQNAIKLIRCACL